MKKRTNTCSKFTHYLTRDCRRCCQLAFPYLDWKSIHEKSWVRILYLFLRPLRLIKHEEEVNGSLLTHSIPGRFPLNSEKNTVNLYIAIDRCCSVYEIISMNKTPSSCFAVFNLDHSFGSSWNTAYDDDDDGLSAEIGGWGVRKETVLIDQRVIIITVELCTATTKW